MPDPTRRAILLGAAATAAAAGFAWSPAMTARMPAIYLPHGGGPWPWMPPGQFGPMDSLKAWLQGIPAALPERPRAILSVTAHWEESVPTVSSAANPPMLYDYYGFPPETYTIQWPAPGEPALAARVRALLGAAGIASGEDTARGYDHGTFVPLAVAWPKADIPVVQLSLVKGLDPETHLRIGQALAPLRDEGVLIVGSGMSYHNMRGFMSGGGKAASESFDAWLDATCVSDAPTRDAGLRRWAEAPGGRACHPREEHLLPLMVIAGAAGTEVGKITYNEQILGVKVSAVQFG